jgi:hypothetical protein
MKKIFLCWLLSVTILFTQSGKSQDSSTIQGLLQYIMQPLDKNQIGNGYLEEYGFPAISMATYNGTLSTNNRFELNSWRLLYFQLFTGWCRSTSNPMTPIGTVNNTIKTNTSPTLPIAIPILIGQYNNVKANAFSSNLLSYNASQRKVYDVAGRTQNPYESKRLFAAVPVNQYSTDGSESFIYRSNMVWGNTALTVSQLQINFGNGAGLQTLTANTAININYADTGAYVWTIRATLSDNSVVQCYSDYFVLAVSSGAQRFLPTNITTPSWGTIAAVTGVHSGATVNIVYSSKLPTTPATLRKPLIIVENMDAFNIAPALQSSPYRMQNFLSALNETNLNGYDFNQQLDDIAGYDLVFINFNDGMDGIVRNAAVVREAIIRVNANKQFDNRSNRREQNVVLGMGTGGLHARYALASMAKSTPVVNSETRLLITHDAPHRGANIALGLQHLSRMLGNFSYFGFTSADVFPEYAETVAFLNAPINVETLLYRATSDVANSANTFMNTTYRTMVDFAPGAQPWQFVPTSLGNECAAPLFPAGRQFMNFGLGTATGVKAKLSVFGITIPAAIPLIDLKYDCAVFASSVPSPAETNRKIAELKTVFKFVLFGLIQVAKSGYDKKADVPSSYLAVDGVPGSFNTILDFSELRNFQSAVGNWSFSQDFHLFDIPIYKNVVKLKFYAFIKAYAYNSGEFTTQYTALPVGSALDVDPFNSSTFTQKFVNGSNPAFLSKGNTYIAQETNTSQSLYNNASMRFTARNARFLFKEMELLPNSDNCSPECANPYAIAGTDPVCASSTFFVQGLQRGVSVNWLISPSGFATLTVIDGKAIVNRISNADAVVTLTANIGAGCTSGSTITRQIVIGRGVSSLSFTQCIVTCDAGPYLFANIAPVPGATACNWYYKDMSNSSNPFVFLEDAMFGTDWPLIRGNRNYTIRAEVITPCGNVIGDYVVFAPSCRGMRVAASPNPVSDNLNISFFDVDDVSSTTKQHGQELNPLRSLQSTGKTIVTLFELTSGLQAKQWMYKEISSKGYKLSLAGVRKGLYLLQVDRNNNTTTTKVIVE